MSTYERLIQNMHKLQRNDPFTLAELETIAEELDIVGAQILDFKTQYYFDTVTWYIGTLAKELGIHINPTLPIEEQRAIIESRWKIDGKSDIFLLHAIADSWKNGEIEVDFIDGKIQVKFASIVGVPPNLDNLKDALETAKPAHLAILYLFKYLLIKDVHNKMTLAQLEQQKLANFA